MKDKKVKDQAKIEREHKKHVEKEKKRLSKLVKFHKKEKIDKATEKLGLGLSHSSEERHILLFNPIDIAQEIARINSEKFCSIPNSDFLHQRWSKNPENSNITSCITHFNNVNNFKYLNYHFLLSFSYFFS